MFTPRHAGLYLAIAGLGVFSFLGIYGQFSPLWATGFGGLLLIGIHDLVQTHHSVLRNYPILGHFRFMFEAIRPELRQYIVESETEEIPFSRAQRSIVYQRAKNAMDSRAFGTELRVNDAGHEWINHSLAPSTIADQNFRILIGAKRPQPYSLSVFNISAMSFGALSANAIRALNSGAKMGGFAHDTGEGSLSAYHKEFGGDLIWEIGSGYFGCRNADGSFSPELFTRQATDPQVKMIEIKLSQGAKPGHGGVLPAAKITPEIAATRGIPMGRDCVSPAAHSEFCTPVGLLAFVDKLRNLSGGKPTEFKLCIGAPWEFLAIAKAMMETGILPDFIVIDGAEGGTGAAPLEFVDHVGMPLQEGLLLVHNTLKGLNLRDQIKLGASGKLITAFDIARTLAIGADWVNSARGFMFAVGCIQAQACNTGRCPTGVATQDKNRQKALVVPDKAERVYNFHRNTLHALKELLQASGLHHPSELRPYHIMRRISAFEVQPLSRLLPYIEDGDLLANIYRHPVFEHWWPLATSQSFAVPGKEVAETGKTEKPEWCHVDGNSLEMQT
ncbi:FMN-binding glutamate synthase family protein [Oxalobacteraceae bacterium R-40]|uniref:FMN-binding glutamate synthase family protein n=1 Tax=Keguizhuia sedimenti TaxID=3064264 RepID=A0ABU1BQB3_9BURK|nr:FMN-binding glutamate synthase family protein [Oxalobacteraceae bacterium R-40]